MSDLSSAVKCAIQYIEGKHPSDAPLKKLVQDVVDEANKLKTVVEGFADAYSKDAVTLTSDALATVADVAKLAASPFAVSQIGGDIQTIIALAKQFVTDIDDVKKAIADFKAGSSDPTPPTPAP